MACSPTPKVRLERQPHRDAIHRLRQAYRRLWLAAQPQHTKVDPRMGAQPPSPMTVQEVIP